MQKMLDLLYTVCYNLITSERFFFFAKEPVKMSCAVVRVLFVRFLLRAGAKVGAKPREAFTFTLPKNRLELVKAKNISVKREVPL